MLKKKYYILNITSYILLAFYVSSCALVGIHVRLQNPKHAGRYPHFSETTKLLGKENTKYRTCFDATYYELNVTVDENKKQLKGTVTMNATAVSDFDTIQLDLYANMKVNSIGYATLNSISEKDSKFINATYVRKYGAIFIPFKQKAGEIFKIKIDYEGSPRAAKKPPWDGGFVWKHDKEKNPWIGVACETEGASLWWPCKDVNNDEPDSASINITCAKNLVAVSNGKLRGKEEHENTSTYKWFVSYPINLYDVTLYIGNFVLLPDSYQMPSGKILPVNHYVRAPNYEKAKEHFKQAKDQISFYEKTFGEFPWYNDGYKLVESPYEGMEHQSAIAYGNGYKNNSFSGNFDYIILHESAHEWWGNGITAADFADVWLQEGFATYSEALYVESTQGKSAYYRYLLVYRLFIQNKWPVVGPVGYRYFYYKNSDCYQKGAWVLNSLRTLINDDKTFFDILKSYYEKYKYKTVSSQNFIDLVNEKTGNDYGWFFKQYLYKRETPFLEYDWDGKDFYYRWKYANADFKMPAEILLDNLVQIKLSPSTEIQKLPIAAQTYKNISFNDYMLLFGVEENKKLRKEFKK
ncbi:MAG: M1 family metallopeptidase [Bacteroidetes bacterium]|nr:M1 family metallopeptidase [Bacteroidota bacterium]